MKLSGMKSIFDTGIRPKVFIAIIATSLTLLLVSTQILIRNSKKFQAAKHFIENNQEIRSQVGDIKGYGYFINSREKSDTVSYLIFTINGSLSSKKISVCFKRDSTDEWKVDKF